MRDPGEIITQIDFEWDIEEVREGCQKGDLLPENWEHIEGEHSAGGDLHDDHEQEARSPDIASPKGEAAKDTVNKEIDEDGKKNRNEGECNNERTGLQVNWWMED